ncbi:MAG: aminomethyltransferase family protein [Planctomycetia bacterium]|nr:aminomethyltransferase family protein [Planctomycetia bacterium]
MAQRSPLHDITSQAGAIFAEVCGWELPAHFGDAGAEYTAALSQAVLFDRSHHGLVEAAGKEARIFLHNLSTNHIKELPEHGSCEAFFATVKAKAIAYVLIHHLKTEGKHELFWIDAGPAQGEKVFKHLDRHLISEQVELADRTAECAQLHLAGPGAALLLAKVQGDASYRYLHSFRVQDPLGVPGFDLVVPAARGAEIWERLLAEGSRPAGTQVYDWLRVEAGTPIYGRDIDEERFVVEVGRGERAISYHKGCYLGQEPIVMARDRGHVNRKLMGVTSATGVPLAKDTKLLRDGNEVGQVMSSVVSPRFGAIALAYLRRGSDAPGLELTAEQGPVTVTALPFGAAVTSSAAPS